MIAVRKIAGCVAAAVVLTACGGGTNRTIPSLYAGAWSGTWNGVESNDGGTMTLTVTSDGSTSGTMTRAGGLGGTLAGVINNTGHLTASVSFPSSGNFVVNGQVVLNVAALDGSFNYSWLGQNYTGSLSLTSQSTTPTGGSPASVGRNSK